MLEELPTLTPYQVAWLKVPRYTPRKFKDKSGEISIEQKATIKCLTKSRRIGGSFACQLEAVLNAAGIDYGTKNDVPPTDTYVVSATERQAKEFIKECGELAEFFAESDLRFQVKCQSTIITFKHTGKRIIALPASGRAIRGATGRLVLDEICFMPKFEEIWGAAKPLAQGTMKVAQGFPISVLSTPWAKGTEAYKVLTKGRPYFCFEMDLKTAIEQGFKGVRSINQVRNEVANDEIFRVEYMCQWLETGTSYFPEYTIRQNLTDEWDVIEKMYPDNPVIWGVDIGRTHDLTVASKFIQVEETLYLVDSYVMRGIPMHDQASRLIDQIGENPTLVRVDRGMQGYSVYDAFIAKYGRHRVASADLNQDSQVRHMMNLKDLLEKKRLKICSTFKSERTSNPLIMELLKIEQKATSGGRVVMHTPRDMHGHCDRAWSVAIGVGKYIRDTPSDISTGIIGVHESPINEQRIDVIQQSINAGILDRFVTADGWLCYTATNG